MSIIKKQVIGVALAVAAVGIHQSFGVQVTANYSVGLTVASSFWRGPLYISSVTITGTETLQATDQSQQGLLRGTTAVAKFSNKNILPAGSKARLVVVWNDGDTPYLAAFTPGQRPAKIDGYTIGILQLEDPEDPASTINGTLAVKVSGNLLVPATDNINVPKTARSVSGITRYTFGVAGTTPLNPAQPIQGWGTYVADFKKLFSGKATLTGAAIAEL